MKDSIARVVSQLIRGVVPSAAVASSLLAPPALSRTGDLDPSFADLGRMVPLTPFEGEGPAWSISALDNDDSFFAGGHACVGFYCDFYYHYFDTAAVLGRLSDAGVLDASFNTPRLVNTEVLDVVMQPDGKAVAVGFTTSSPTRFEPRLTVFRLQREGQLDLTFGDAGIVQFDVASRASSVALDPDGGIVIAGWRGDKLIVTRLGTNGATDASFGTAGVFVGPDSDDPRGARLVRAQNGDYLVATNFQSGCRVIALAPNGTVDQSYGTLGDANLGLPANTSVRCSSIVEQPDGRLLVAGDEADHGFALRLLSGGVRDAGFATNAVATRMVNVSAMTRKTDGSVVVAGSSAVAAASVMQLQANGELDILFGKAGTTSIDLPSERGPYPNINDVTALADGRVLVAGGATRPRAVPFVVRLVGDSGADSPGVVGVVEASSSVVENQQAVITVRRTGGDAGSISVGYRTAVDSQSAAPATAGQDYPELSGRLTWGPGDTADQTVSIPIPSNETPEEPENFLVALVDAQGGAGLATRNATVEIAADGAPNGQFSVAFTSETVAEAQTAQVIVSRNYYTAGAVSVTLTPTSGTATLDQDFSASPMTVSWADGVSDPIIIDIPITNDTDQEDAEAFTVALSAPTGGAILGPHATASIQINANDQPPPPPPPAEGSRGGGALDFLSLLLLGPLAWLRGASSRRRSNALSD